jgi:hypothetical protein
MSVNDSKTLFLSLTKGLKFDNKKYHSDIKNFQVGIVHVEMTIPFISNQNLKTGRNIQSG